MPNDSEPVAVCATVALWLLPLADGGGLSGELASRCEALLGAPERARLAAFGAATRRQEFLLGHALARLALCEARPGSRPDEWGIGADADGAPTATGPESLPLSIAHTPGAVAVAVADAGELGVDIEWCGRRSDVMRLAARFFGERERADIERCPESGRLLRFLSLWTLKEAYLKARGTGLRMPLRAIEFHLRRSEPAEWPDGASSACSKSSDIGVRFHPPLDDQPARWTLRQWRTDSGHLLALAWAPGPAAVGRSILHRIDTAALSDRLRGAC